MKNIDVLEDWLDIQEHQMVGEILMQGGKLSLEDLGLALDLQRFQDMRLGDILVSMKIINKDELERVLELQKQIDELIEKRG